MEGLDLSSLPAWAIFALGVIYLVLQFVRWVLERQRAAERREQIEEYRKTRTIPPPADGLHAAQDVRLLIEQDREHQELLTHSRESVEIMRRLVNAEAQQGELLGRIVEMLERERETHDALLAAHREMAEVLRGIAHEMTDWRTRIALAERVLDARAEPR